jgi:hypothetical protein
MNRDDIFEKWQGSAHPWVAWVKPSLFDRIADSRETANGDDAWSTEAPPWLGIDTSWLPKHAAVIIDLPAEEGLILALALAQRDVRPVLAINACSASGEVIDMRAAQKLLDFAARHAPAFPAGMQVRPAFILDARRDGSNLTKTAGMFDNRWELFASDLPSVEELRTAGITQVVVAQNDQRVRGDLEAILCAYQAGGLQLQLRDARQNHFTSLNLSKRNWLSRLFGTIHRRLSYRRRWDGSFGRTIPEEPSHG